MIDSNDESSSNDDKNTVFLDRVAGKLLVSSDAYYGQFGEKYTDQFSITHIFVKDISKTKGVYQLQRRDFYYGHEIIGDVLYITNTIATDIYEINWESTSRVGVLINDYSASFLSNVKAKSLAGCENYFDPYTGRTYVEKYASIEDAFRFEKALSTTKAIYKNEKSLSFIGLTTLDENLYVTDAATDIDAINWESSANVGKLK